MPKNITSIPATNSPVANESQVTTPIVDSPALEDANSPTPVPDVPGLGIAPIEEPSTNPGPIPIDPA